MSLREAAGLAETLPDAAFEWQVAHDPHVRTLCLTSEQDDVIKAAGVRKFAEMLTAAQPGRPVRVATLKGAHVMLAHVDGQRYDQAIKEVLVEDLFKLLSLLKLQLVRSLHFLFKSDRTK